MASVSQGPQAYIEGAASIGRDAVVSCVQGEAPALALVPRLAIAWANWVVAPTHADGLVVFGGSPTIRSP